MATSSMSPLTAAYMEFHEDIVAGEEAFRADVPVFLRALGDRLSARRLEVEVDEYTVEMDLSVPATKEPLRLRLRWDDENVWPALSINDNTSYDIENRDDPKLCLFYGDDFHQDELPSVDRVRLVDDPVTELCRLWDTGLAFPNSRAYAVRDAGILLVEEVSRLVLGELEKAKLPDTVMDNDFRPGDADADAKNWPWFFQWFQTISGGRKPITVEWAFTYFPSFQRAGSDPTHALVLVVNNGASVAKLKRHARVVGDYLKEPIVGDWSEQLAEAGENPSRRKSIAKQIAKQVLEIYKSVLKSVREQ